MCRLCWYNLDVLICVSVLVLFSFFLCCSFYFYGIFYGCCGVIQIKMMMMMMMMNSLRFRPQQLSAARCDDLLVETATVACTVQRASVISQTWSTLPQCRVSATMHSVSRHASPSSRDPSHVYLIRYTPVDVDVDVEEIRAQTNNCLYARS